MNFRLTTIIPAAILATGCAAYSIWDLHSAPASLHVDVSANYKQAYERVLQKMQACLKEGYVTGFVEPRVNHALYEGARTATLTVVNTNVWREHHLVHVSFRGIDSQKTQLDAYAAYPDWDVKVKAIKDWVSNPDAPCSISRP